MVSFQRFRGALERCRQRRQLLAGAVTISLVESFVHAGNDDRGVAGIFSWRVNGVTEPGAVWQALPWRHEQGALGVTQRLVQAGSIARRILLPRQNLRSSSLEMMNR